MVQPQLLWRPWWWLMVLRFYSKWCEGGLVFERVKVLHGVRLFSYSRGVVQLGGVWRKDEG